MRFYKTPRLIQQLLPGFTWRQEVAAPVIYLTFDDGPIPGVTEFVLEQLALYGARATFFCVGDNVHRHPDIAQRVVAAGHRLGNHTFHHLKGWQTTAAHYLDNIGQCQAALQALGTGQELNLFRPPHGRLTRAQYLLVKPQYRVVMWEVLTYDFDAKLAPESCLRQAIQNTRAGSVVVFHDSLKARRNLAYVLPRYLAYFAGLGYQFHAL